MADATFTQSTDSTSRVRDFPPSSQRKIVTGTMATDGSNGASALDIPASLFGLVKIERVLPLVKSDNTLIVVAAPAYDGLSLLGKAAATAAPADIPSGTYLVVVEGY